MKPESAFGQTIRERRKRLELTQVELAHRVGWASVTIQRIEQGTLRPSRQVAWRLAAIFELIDGEREHFVRLARSLPDHKAALPAAPAAAPRSAPGGPPALPTPLTPLIGRAHEVALVCQALGDEAVRWLSLTGPGGIGKTRVAIQAATARSDAGRAGAIRYHGR